MSKDRTIELSPGRFCVIPQRQLSERHFDIHPVWSEHYDYDELDNIESWGLNREAVLRLFRENERGNEHCVYTLLQMNPFPDRMRIFIRAELEAANGKRLKGFVMNEDAYCLAVFSGGQTYIFSRHSMLAAENEKNDKALCLSLDIEGDEIFPLKYVTAYFSQSGEPISGTFRYGSLEPQ